jgi:hypothetical protein
MEILKQVCNIAVEYSGAHNNLQIQCLSLQVNCMFICSINIYLNIFDFSVLIYNAKGLQKYLLFRFVLAAAKFKDNLDSIISNSIVTMVY